MVEALGVKQLLCFVLFCGKSDVEYMHEERAYKETVNGEIILFRLAGEIREL